MNKHMEELKSIQNLTNKIRKISLNESVNFEDDFEMENQGEPQEQEIAPEEAPIEEPQAQEEPKDAEEIGMEELDNCGALDKIRSITLEGMQKLYKEPESPEFQALYKIFQICNKGVEKDEKQA